MLNTPAALSKIQIKGIGLYYSRNSFFLHVKLISNRNNGRILVVLNTSILHPCKKNKVSAAKFEFLYFLYERCLRCYLFKLKRGNKSVFFKKGLNHTTHILLLLISPGFMHLRSGFGRRGLYRGGLYPRGRITGIEKVLRNKL